MGDLENDMDELFRKAASHYPLKTDGADWDKIAGKLPDAAIGTPLPYTKQKAEKSNRKLLWLILLFPMGWLCNAYFNGKSNTKNDAKVIVTTSTDQLNKTSQSNDNQNNKDDKTIVNSKQQTVKETPSNIPINKVGYNKVSGNTNSDVSHNTLYSDKKIPIENSLDVIKSTANDKAGEKKITTDGNTLSNNKLNDGTINTINPVQNNVDKQSPNENKNPSAIDTTQKLAKLNETATHFKNTDTTKSVAKKADKKSTEKIKGFYVSALGGIDASSVKSQGIKKVGYNYGILIGYNLNKHIAFETGLLWDKKQYYTDGSYFNKSRTSIPSTITLSDMNGNCNMFELPIAFRYNMRQNKKTLFFGTVGLSSYFMKSEAYNYEAEMNGNSWYAMKTYNNSGNNLFSILNLSVGYEHKIGKLVSLRVNPYLNIPLKGLGIGSLPITSSGVNIGITVPFHK